MQKREQAGKKEKWPINKRNTPIIMTVVDIFKLLSLFLLAFLVQIPELRASSTTYTNTILSFLLRTLWQTRIDG